jgi:hypothetical protein
MQSETHVIGKNLMLKVLEAYKIRKPPALQGRGLHPFIELAFPRELLSGGFYLQK